ncbi:MAG: phosphotransferase, partial [Acidimicrobiia bacterium]|nr:phosphotransferase [Acidimicrobiia bacterium]
EYAAIALHRHPGFETALHWLRANLPATTDPAVFCHGDFRFANLTWTGPGELGAVLDWERAWVGDPMADIAFTRQFSGWCAVEGDVTATYEAASGRTISEERVAYGLRFERARAYLSPLRVMRAVFERRAGGARLVALAEAGEAGIWEMTEWDHHSSGPTEVPDTGPDWTDGLEDPDLILHFTENPRPVCERPRDRARIEETAAQWKQRPMLRSRRSWG